jgi:1-acyl-sn-glycerol-3-phosphate acyltransferase
LNGAADELREAAQALCPGAGALRFHASISWLVARVYYRVRTLGEDRSPPRVETRPTFYLCLHRNGAVDGWANDWALRRWSPRGALALLGANLRRNPITRLFAVGLPLVRAKDRGGDPQEAAAARRANEAAIAASVNWLKEGGSLQIYPEGTSDLGPKPLPFHRGAAHLAGHALRALPRGELLLRPVLIDYEAPATPGSRVDVLVGAPVPTDDLDPQDPALTHLLHQRIADRLRAMAFVFDDEAHQAAARAQANLFRDSDARLERLRWLSLDESRINPDPGAPDRPRRLLAVALAAPGALLNAPLAAASWLAARRMADGPNVVAFWRILVGLALAPVWLAASATAGVALFGGAGLALPLAQILLGALALRQGAALFARRPLRASAPDPVLDSTAAPTR